MRVVLTMPAFWMCLGAILAGLAVGAWFYLRIVRLPFEAIVFGLPVAFLISISIVLYVLLRDRAASERIGPSPHTVDLARRRARTELVASPVLLVGAAVTFYLQATWQWEYIGPVLLVSLVLWYVIRTVMRRNNR